MSQKGQIKIVIILLIAVGTVLVILFTGLFKGKELPGLGPKEEKEEVLPGESGLPPIRLELLPAGTLPAGTKETKISVNINEPGYCRYSSKSGQSYDSMTGRFSYNKDKTFHSTTIKSLSTGKTYKYYVRCRDLAGNKNLDDSVIEFSIGGLVPSPGLSAPSLLPKEAPPIRSNLLPMGTLSTGTKETKISVNINEPGYCRYSTKSGQSYDSMTGRFSYDKEKLLHTATVKGLTDNKIYEYFVRCRDLEGNKNNDDVVIRFGIGGIGVTLPSPGAPGADTVPPSRFSPSPTKDKELPTETRQVTIGLGTDEKATCKYSTVSGMSYNAMIDVFSNTNSTLHSTLVTGLNEGEYYKYYIKCMDQYGNKNTNDFLISFKIKPPEDFTPPERRNPYPSSDVFPAGTIQTMISISTNEPASCRYSLEQGVSYKSMKYSFVANEAKTYHAATVKGLQNGKAYEYFVRCKDLAGNENTGDVMIQFSVSI